MGVAVLFEYRLHLALGDEFIEQTGTPAAPIATVVQKQDYYPFGKTKSIVTGVNSKYLYNGKETAMRFMRSAKRQIIFE
ncbi:hypothetical protein LZQ00_09270 [Sphingobacterium sp. SRCM116780]|uniref:hypothetical protein n=1 Tax=Sphingobacterium sp. SRCM116780 TaxID=2907623 RepID=UPI001F34801B|nr:hypothetical protein [Sphingobacterium sp. SRCM116780]UIR57991.1 hypothetical protein LZQ00_09270 [Sphingobacterium sp. SRCM116780]